MNALEVRQLTVRFGRVVAVDGVNLTVGAGEVVGLIGPNGSGKTSLLDAVSGMEPYEGTVYMEDVALDRFPPHVRARRGLGRTFQSLELFEDLTVRDNIAVVERDGSKHKDHVSRALTDLGLAELECRPVASLGNAQRRFVALARALSRSPRVVLLDEVAAGLDAGALAHIASCVREAAAASAAVVLVDHDLDLVLTVADRVVVLDRGQVIADGAPDAVRNDAKVIAAYLGTAS